MLLSLLAVLSLLAHDRALGQRGVQVLGPAATLGEALAPDAVMPAPGIGFAEGRDAILALLQRDTLNASSRFTWQPLRAGISADGTHGVTIGLMTVTRADGSVRPFKYLAYWVRGADGWRMRVFRRMPRVDAPIDETVAAPWLPPEGGAAGTAACALSPAAFDAERATLQRMETVFSDTAAAIGIGPAFARFGAADAWHLGSPTAADFTRGVEAIAAAVQGGAPAGSSPVTWSAERTLLAPSGDFGVNLGYIVPLQAGPDGQRPRIPFFTVWQRTAAGWRYIAE